ncbi:hypothetical protein SAMN00790413_06358 [Deinococcus hopiensis KR-140]|uniref:Uncharacterized protein n=1 Tax=Deinococcus hopiensis KR-140 TaxID=695939 RepID=A0A1W1VUS8_9DEIO|nr:hypothetical protein SAMN00790413_06358 [Deinococcus hopiensis KR-140]
MRLDFQGQAEVRSTTRRRFSTTNPAGTSTRRGGAPFGAQVVCRPDQGFQRPAEKRSLFSCQFSGVSCIRPQVLHFGEKHLAPPRRRRTAPARGKDIRFMHFDRHDEAGRIHEQITLPSIDLLTAVVTTWPPHLGGYDRLAVNHSSTWCLRASFSHSDDLHAIWSATLPTRLAASTSCARGRLFARGKDREAVARQATTSAEDGEDALQNFLQRPLARSTHKQFRWGQRLEDVPPGIGEVVWEVTPASCGHHLRPIIPPSSTQVKPAPARFSVALY